MKGRGTQEERQAFSRARATLEMTKDTLWETTEGHNLVVIAAGLNDILRENRASIRKQMTKGAKDLRASSYSI